MVDSLVVTEVRDKPSFHIFVVCTAGVGRIAHIACYTAMIHQGSHSRLLCLCGIVAVVVQHIAPLVGCRPKVSRERLVIPCVRMRAYPFGRILICIQQLRGSSSHASRNRAVAPIHRAEVIIRRILIPLRRAQRAHRRI